MKLWNVLTLVALGASLLALLPRSKPMDEERRGTLEPAPVELLSERLERRIEQIEARLSGVESRPAALLEPVREPAAPVASVDAIEARLQARLDALANELRRLAESIASAPTGSWTPGLEQQVAEVLNNVRQEERTSKIKAYRDSRVERLDATVSKLEERLGLSGYQSSELRGALESQLEREAEVIALWEAGASDEELGARKQADQEAHQVELQTILTFEQLQLYRASSSDEK